MKKKVAKDWKGNCKCHGVGLALILLVIGLFWLGKDMGWIDVKISIWPILLIVLALYWIVKAVWGNNSCCATPWWRSMSRRASSNRMRSWATC